jgi:hypothetical protein
VHAACILAHALDGGGSPAPRHQQVGGGADLS